MMGREKYRLKSTEFGNTISLTFECEIIVIDINEELYWFNILDEKILQTDVENM